MKMRYLLLMAVFLVTSCKEEFNTPTTPIDDNYDTEMSVPISSGTFIGVGHTVNGTATIFDDNGSNVLVLDPFTSQNGPDLKIYLSKSKTASGFVNLGPMKSTVGKQSYAIPSGTSILEYPYVLVWCQEFSVLFGYAELK